MSHDRGCWKCGADTMADKRECWQRIGWSCVKSSFFAPGPKPRTNREAPECDSDYPCDVPCRFCPRKVLALKFWQEKP